MHPEYTRPMPNKRRLYWSETLRRAVSIPENMPEDEAAQAVQAYAAHQQGQALAARASGVVLACGRCDAPLSAKQVLCDPCAAEVGRQARA